jgi:hypothetical protein
MGLTFGATALYPLAMRVLGLLILLVIGLGFGAVPMPATAEPCPHPTHSPAATHGTYGQAAAPAAEVVVVAARDRAGVVAPHPASDHAIPEGQSCCHAAPAAAQAIGIAVVPYRRMAGTVSLDSGLPPRAAPTTDIYRPPAFA